MTTTTACENGRIVDVDDPPTDRPTGNCVNDNEDNGSKAEANERTMTTGTTSSERWRSRSSERTNDSEK